VNDYATTISHARAALDLSQSQLAARIKAIGLRPVSVRTIQRIESGKCNPQARTRHRIETALGMRGKQDDKT
jgi:ribosome-binding protein aMBF1 (putative translation factor)